MEESIASTLEKYHHDPTRLMDILIDVQSEFSCISDSAIKQISRGLDISIADVEQTRSFYHFFSKRHTGEFSIFLNTSVNAYMMGRDAVARTFEQEAGIPFNEVTPDGLIGLFDTSCIGMSDQEPAAIINGKIFPNLTPFRVKELIRDIRAGKSMEELVVEGYGDGENSNEDIRAVVNNNIRKIGPVLDPQYRPGDVIWKILPEMSPDKVIAEIKKSNIRGRGGAGFPTGMKWELARQTESDEKYIICNADEGEPGTFKDRVILTERPKLLLEGMVIAAYATGAKKGILYVRHEYKYLKTYLENLIKGAHERNLMGKDIAGIKGFEFDVRIQYGAGSYVCGEESALIESAEGKRGEPRDKPPFPVERGYLGKPTVVNNVETFCSAVKVLLNGADWYRSFGTKDSTGTKVLSISGDCRYPGVYEVEWGFTVRDLCEMSGAVDVKAVQVGGPSGSLVGPEDFDRTLCFADLSTGGSLIMFNYSRDLLQDVVLNFTSFFIEESCGSCSTCRVMPVILRDKLQKILNARGVKSDVSDMLEWAKVLKSSRCGLGQTAANPIVTSIRNFPDLYDQKIRGKDDYDTGFDLNRATRDAMAAAGRLPVNGG
ncbi:NAD(P)H-dependent oxidoreductase subunit E [Natronogracilivirga saccharolytica]|uniref:NAD(P)H-dependent oxidoreductase subunit E n=1 Tax=Natronogracilivirga saccharolytica TaxID=2812953 RepID=A0A8J7RL93_9BACT|nr:NAD(P)H-dependent oxidoreductase subunit E [Natronogracilivirga saccharolytica]MBP3191749.1 NAD(P)H-dependent oxidoreductase subunit E [Natronogracilivirga saccharolytica]